MNLLSQNMWSKIKPQSRYISSQNLFMAFHDDGPAWTHATGHESHWQPTHPRHELASKWSQPLMCSAIRRSRTHHRTIPSLPPSPAKPSFHSLYLHFVHIYTHLCTHFQCMCLSYSKYTLDLCLISQTQQAPMASSMCFLHLANDWTTSSAWISLVHPHFSHLACNKIFYKVNGHILIFFMWQKEILSM